MFILHIYNKIKIIFNFCSGKNEQKFFKNVDFTIYYFAKMVYNTMDNGILYIIVCKSR